MKFSILIVLMFSFFQSFAADLNITSDPQEADIYVRELGEENLKKIGVTPLKISLNEITGNFVKGNYFMLVLKKKGYQSYRIVLNSLVKSNLRIKARMDILDRFDTFKKVDKYTIDIFEAQRLLRGKQNNAAIQLLNRMSKDYPYISTIPEMLGSAHYLNKNLTSALDSYKKAFRLNPDNIDAYNMKQLIEKKIVSKKVGN